MTGEVVLKEKKKAVKADRAQLDVFLQQQPAYPLLSSQVFGSY